MISTLRINTNWRELMITHLDSTLKDPLNGLNERIGSVRVSELWWSLLIPPLLLCLGYPFCRPSGRRCKAQPPSGWGPAVVSWRRRFAASLAADGCPCAFPCYTTRQSYPRLSTLARRRRDLSLSLSPSHGSAARVGLTVSWSFPF